MKNLTKLWLTSSLMLALQACTTTNTNNNTVVTPPTEVIEPTGSNVPMPISIVSEVKHIPTSKIPATVVVDDEDANVANEGGNEIDVSLLDDFLADITPNARHYPPNFPNNTQRYNARQQIKAFEKMLKPYVDAPNASYEVLIRAAQLSGMARNLDMGSSYTVSGGDYVSRALQLKPNDIEANLLYGIMLSEGGAFKTGRKYLSRAAELGSLEAEQSIAQTDLLRDKRKKALSRLQKLQENYPNNQLLPVQIAIIESGKYYIWNIPAPNVDVKPVS